MPQYTPDDREATILVVGSGVAENVLVLTSPVRFGQKHLVHRHALLGGSGLNYTLRLVHTGHAVLPVLSIGDDYHGHEIQKAVTAAMQANIGDSAVLPYIKSSDFVCHSFTTPQSTILVAHDQRTIFTEKLHGLEHFKPFVQAKLDRIDQNPELAVKVVMIGHIYADSPELNPTGAGSITRSIIDRYRGQALIYANFGNSQIRLGYRSWEAVMDDIMVFQLALDEIRAFFREEDRTPTLLEIIQWLRDHRITAVITLDRFGAIATYQDGADGIILAWPFELTSIVDTTGAGDAFGTGLVSAIYRPPALTFQDFLDALETARVWAAYACTTLGGASECPDEATLAAFADQLHNQDEYTPVEVRKLEEAELIIRLLDKAY